MARVVLILAATTSAFVFDDRYKGFITATRVTAVSLTTTAAQLPLIWFESKLKLSPLNRVSLTTFFWLRRSKELDKTFLTKGVTQACWNHVERKYSIPFWKIVRILITMKDSD